MLEKDYRDEEFFFGVIVGRFIVIFVFFCKLINKVAKCVFGSKKNKSREKNFVFRGEPLEFFTF